MTRLRDAPPGTLLQVCHVVRDVEASAARWVRDFGAGPFFRATFAIDGHTYRGQPHRVNVDVAVGFMGSSIVELTRPVEDAPSPFTEVLNARGEGLHHYWLQVDDFDAALVRHAGAGHALVTAGPLPGIGRAAMVDTSAKLGCFVELIELNDTGWRLMEQMHATHLGWDGRDPLRPYPAF